MPRYYFHIFDGPKPDVINEGLDLPNNEAAWVEATAACGEILRDMNGSLKPGSEWKMRVKDDAGTDLFELEFRTKAFGS